MLVSEQHLTIKPERQLSSVSCDEQRHLPRTIWLTGLSGAGKSTLANHVAQTLLHAGKRIFILDGDVVRTGLCRDLGFSAEDRAENIRRVAEVARLMNLAGVSVIAALISPFRAERERAAQIIGEDSFREVHISTSLEVCAERDVKGLYAKARAGLIPEFTGISSPYEAPVSPCLRIDTQLHSIEESSRLLIQLFNQC